MVIRYSDGTSQKLIYATVEERPADCVCSWAYDYGKSTWNGPKIFRLIYRNFLCPAALWHARKEAE